MYLAFGLDRPLWQMLPTPIRIHTWQHRRRCQTPICSAFVSLMEIHGGFEFERRMEGRRELIWVTRQTPSSPSLAFCAHPGGKFGATMPRAIVRLVLRTEDEAEALTHDKPKRKADTFWRRRRRRSKKTPRKLLVGVVRFRLRSEISISPPKVDKHSPPNLRRR